MRLTSTLQVGDDRIDLVRSSAWRATIRAISAFSATMSTASLVSSAST